jgi:hypothetical protein
MVNTASADRSNGYEAVAEEFVSCRNRSGAGISTVRKWAKSLPVRATVLMPAERQDRNDFLQYKSKDC